VARGFDSKSVTDQQEEKERAHDRKSEDVAPASARRRSLELARVDLVRRIETASGARREVLRTVLADLDELIQKA